MTLMSAYLIRYKPPNSGSRQLLPHTHSGHSRLGVNRRNLAQTQHEVRWKYYNVHLRPLPLSRYICISIGNFLLPNLSRFYMFSIPE